MKTTLQKIVSRVKFLGKKYPRAKYNKIGGIAFYTKGKVSNGPKLTGCIIGQAICHVRPDLRKRLTTMDMNACAPVVEDCLMELKIISRCTDDSDFLDRVQSNQDRGKSWGKSLDINMYA